MVITPVVNVDIFLQGGPLGHTLCQDAYALAPLTAMFTAYHDIQYLLLLTMLLAQKLVI